MAVRRLALLGWALLFVLPCAARPQGNLAAVTGVVTDTAKAAMPGVAITIRNLETNVIRRIQTSESGDFTITNLPPGLYELTAEMPGFRTYRKRPIELQVGQMFRDDVEMQVGLLRESVTVTAEVAPINTESGTTKGDVIIHQEIQDLPLEGRDFFDLALLVPGVYPRAQGGQGSGLVVNGARGDNTNYYVDGFNNRNPRGAAPQIRPNMDALQEFRMETSGFSAEYGRMAGGIMNMALRSGTNRLRGTIFEYLRNDVLDARGFFDIHTPKLRRNQFGATLSGPVVLPRVYRGRDRTFFLFSWEGYTQVLEQTRLGRTPTLLEREGDFSQSADNRSRRIWLRDPLQTGSCNALSGGPACFPDNRMPAARFHPIALKLLQYYPLPNRADTRNNYRTSADDHDTWNTFLWKIDHRLSEKRSVAFRYQKRFARTSGPFNGSDLGTFGNKVQDDRSLLGLDYTHMFSPSFLVELRAGFSRNATLERSVWTGRNIAAELGIAGTTDDPELLGFPRFTVLNHFPLGDAVGQPLDYHVTDIQAGAKFTRVQSKHLLKWGFDVSRVRFNQPFNNNVRGTFAFQDQWTNHPVGDFLLGMLNNTSRRVGTTRNYVRAISYGAFFNDDYKIARSLTLNLGIRYELDMPIVDRYDRMSNFIPGLNRIIISSDRNIPNLQQLLAEAVVTAGARRPMSELVGLARDYDLPRSLVFADYNNFAPRVGFAWRPFASQRTVLRGGYGVFTSGHLLNPVRASLMQSYPFAINETYSRQAARPDLVTMSNPFPVEREVLGGINNSSGYELHAPTGYLQSYNLTIERDLGHGMALETAYVGSKGTHLGRRYDLNQPIRSRAIFDAAGTFPRPIFGLNTIDYYSFGSNSIYNAGQVSFRRRSRGGAFYRVNYVYSKSIDDASQISGVADGGFDGAQNARDLKSERARSDSDIGHAVTAAFSWPLPVGRGKTVLRDARGWKNRLLGGWQLTGTVSLYTGRPLTVLTSAVDANLGESQRPNRIASGKEPDRSDGSKRGVDYPWFRVSAFERVPRCETTPVRQCGTSQYGFEAFRFGNSGRNILDGPGLSAVNLSFMKNFRMREQRNLQVRWDTFNAINRANFMLPNRTFDAPNGGIIIRNVDSGRGGPRVMQVSLKLDF